MVLGTIYIVIYGVHIQFWPTLAYKHLLVCVQLPYLRRYLDVYVCKCVCTSERVCVMRYACARVCVGVGICVCMFVCVCVGGGGRGMGIFECERECVCVCEVVCAWDVRNVHASLGVYVCKYVSVSARMVAYTIVR